MSSLFQSLFNQLSVVKLINALEKKLSSSSLSLLDEYKEATANNTTAPSSTKTTSRPFSEIIREASQAYGIDENVIGAVIRQESSYNPKAVSSCGAMGLMQLMPGTAKSLGVTNAFDAEQNIMAGTKYLKQKLDEFNGSLPLALAAYNAGSGAVRKHGGVPPYKETVAYVNKIMKSVDHMA
ncbi:MAG: lytic transglycosylase domain-containing protein [Syntrophomonas sp.]